MIYDIRHTTKYEYGAPVADARCVLRLTPLRAASQDVQAFAIDIAPRPQRLWERQGFFGERITYADIATPHSALTIETRARVDITRARPPASRESPAWESVRAAALEDRNLGPDSPTHFLEPSANVPLHAPATEYARASFPPGRPMLEALVEFMQRMRADFRFDSHATGVTTPLAEAFERRAGVCQDFAHVMIASLRGLCLPAGYVSGYLRTIPPPGSPRLEGADAMHAWAKVWCGPGLGWIGVDPTNALLVGQDHIAVAVGRDYAEATPVRGVLQGFGAQRVAVAVDVTVAE